MALHVTVTNAIITSMCPSTLTERINMRPRYRRQWCVVRVPLDVRDLCFSLAMSSSCPPWQVIDRALKQWLSVTSSSPASSIVSSPMSSPASSPIGNAPSAFVPLKPKRGGGRTGPGGACPSGGGDPGNSK